eukprot:TRINITY_DN2286_c1_g1_i1.p1 TRINITY_DN2286_c1_g1~~TRINITY_DN2286_c1_g1_i1.p1  ORF type:complete len:1258 (+),score=383.18 TRINITY_DN2286_c1_g1_i1:82-3774(+)
MSRKDDAKVYMTGKVAESREGFNKEIIDEEEEEDEVTKRGFFKEALEAGGEEDPSVGVRSRKKIGDKESEYMKRRYDRTLSPTRKDVFTEDAAAPEPATKKSRWDTTEDQPANEEGSNTPQRVAKWDTPTPGKKSRFDTATPTRKSKWGAPATPQTGTRFTDATPTRWDNDAPTPGRWDADADATPGRTGFGETPTRADIWDATPGATPSQRDWDPTPSRATPGAMKWDSVEGGAMPTPKKSKWDDAVGVETPGMAATPAAFGGATPSGFTGATPAGYMGATPAAFHGMTPQQLAATNPELYAQHKFASEIEMRNRPLSDAELDDILPAEGYKIVPFPDSYKPITPARKYTSAPTPLHGAGFTIPETQPTEAQDAAHRVDVTDLGPDMPEMKPEDFQHFSALLNQKPENEMTKQEFKEIWIMKLLLKVKNGDPQQRKAGMKLLTEKARWFGAQMLFDQILPLMMSPNLEDQERHLLVKLIGRILFKLDDLVRPYVHKILVVIEPMLIVEDDYYAKAEGREIISNLAKAAGMPTMIQTMSPDIENVDDYVRNVTARAFAVVASALGIPSILPFLKAVCRAKKSWYARHTGVKIVQQIAILMGCGVLPHMKSLVDIIAEGLYDEQSKVKTATALALAALAEAAAPYGIEAFDSVIKPLWTGSQELRGKPLEAYLKAIGFIIPLMEKEYAEHYTNGIMNKLIEEMKTPNDVMKKIVLKVIKQCVATDGVQREFVRTNISPHFFKNFWVKRMALDRRNYEQLVETTVEIANKVGASEIVEKIVEDLKDENEAYRRMVVETISKVVDALGTVDIDSDLEERLVNGVIYAFQEETSEDSEVVLTGFATIINSLGTRMKPYLRQVTGIIKWRLNNKTPKIRQYAADLVSKICRVIKDCDEELILGNLGVVLYEYLGEEYPEVLGSIIAGLKGIVNVIGMSRMTPPIKDLLPHLTPILKNRHEKVQENCIDLVGRIADRAPKSVPAREWTRICFELLELLKAHKKAIRRAAVNTFGYIAKAIGPSDVLSTLLSNLKVQERQQRVCTTIAIAIVAETCAPFTVIPSLMNEYRVPERNVQNGVLKAFSFMFEYIGEMGSDYCYAVVPLLEDALTDRDVIHRQIACNVVKHMALGVSGLGCEDAITHLLNLVWPNVFETAPHTINSCVEAIEACRVCLGPNVILAYALQGLFHPSRKVREVYWKIYNNIYIGCQDALVPSYPMLPDDMANNYWRSELETFI